MTVLNSFLDDFLGNGVGSGGILCGFTTYWNGSFLVKVDFIKQAPLNLENDRLVSNTITDMDLNDGVERFVEFPLTVNSGNAANAFIYNLGKFGTSAGVAVFHDGTRFLYKWFNDSGNIIAQILNAPPVLEGVEASIKITLSNTKFEIIQDVTTINAPSITAASSNINIETFGYRARTDTQNGNVLVKKVNSSLFGSTNFVSNVSDGLTFRSTNGSVYSLIDGAPTDSQYPNYTPNPDDIVSEPQTGPTKFRNDYAAWDLVGTPVDLKVSGFSEELCFTMRETIKTSSRVLEMDFSGGSVQISYELINKRFVFRVATTNGATQSTSNFGASDTNLEYRIKIWDDINDPDNARTNYWELYDENNTLVFSANFVIDWTGNANGIITAFFMASRSPNVSETDLDLKWHDSSNFGFFNWDTRLKAASDPDRNKVVSSTDYKMVLFDDAETGMLFPHIGLATVVSLVSDTKCAGSNLVIDEETNTAVTDELTGDFVTDEP